MTVLTKSEIPHFLIIIHGVVIIFHSVFIYVSITSLLAFLSYHNFNLGIVIACSFFHILHVRMGSRKLLILLISFLFWLTFFQLSYADDLKELPEDSYTVSVRFYEQPKINGNILQSFVKYKKEKLALSYYLQTEKEKEFLSKKIKPGTICQVSAKLEHPPVPTNPNGFDYRLYLKTQGVSYILKVDQISDCIQSDKITFMEQILRIRQQGIERVHASLSKESAAFVNALLFGDSENIQEDVLVAYQSLGISHLLAISGSHISILTAIIYYVFVRVGLTKETTRVLFLIMLPVYSVLAGASPSVNRAVLMAWMILFFSKWRFSLHPLDSLGLTFILFLLKNPYILYHVGFQLSFLVTAGLILSNAIYSKVDGVFMQTLVVSAIAQIVSIPILLLHFYEFNVISFLVNLLYVPFYTILILPLSLLLFTLLLILPNAASGFAFVMDWLLSLANPFAVKLAKLSELSLILGKPPMLVFLLYWICFIAAFILFEKNYRQWWKLLFLMLIPIMVHFTVVKFSPIGEVTIIDVGQGDSILISLPYNQGNYLIDTGGVISFTQDEWKKKEDPFDPGKDIVIPFLKSKGIGHLDKLIFTHGDADHMGSAFSLLDDFPVKEVLIGKTVNKKDIETNVIEFCRENKIPIVEVTQGMYWKKGKYTFHILAPERNQDSGNDASIVILTQLGGDSWLFTGDLEEAGERRLVNQYPHLRADILKVGHHGSQTSTSSILLSQLQPEIGVISVGRNNRFGHPNPEVLSRLEENDVQVFRTDLDGAITYRFIQKRGVFQTVIKN